MNSTIRLEIPVPSPLAFMTTVRLNEEVYTILVILTKFLIFLLRNCDTLSR